MRPVKSFLEDPIKAAEDVERFQEQATSLYEDMALSVEQNLTNSVIRNGSLDTEIYFHSRDASKGDPIPLIRDSLLANYKYNFNNDGSLSYPKPYLQERIQELWDDGREDSEVCEFLEKLEGEFVDDEIKMYEFYIKEGYGGSAAMGSITMRKLPEDFIQKVDVPEVLKPLVKITRSSRKATMSTLIHELTHVWLAEFGVENYDKNHYENGKVPSTIDEIFSYFVSYLVSGHDFTNNDKEDYDHPEMINWGQNLLIEKNEELRSRGKKTGIDFARSTQAKIIEETINSEENSYEVFLRFCLLENDKRRLQKFRNIEEQLSTDLSRINERIADEELKWEDPSKMEEKILGKIIEKALDGGSLKEKDLEWVSREIRKELEKREKLLEKYRKVLDETADKESNSTSDLQKFGEHLSHLEEKMDEILATY